MPRKASEPRKPRITDIAADEHFTDREEFIEAFLQEVKLPPGSQLPVLVYYGVGGVGKTALINHLPKKMQEIGLHIPYAKYSSFSGSTDDWHKALAWFRHELEQNYGIEFPNFDLLWAVMMAYQGTDVPLIRINSNLNDIFKFTKGMWELGQLVLPDTIGELLKRHIEKSPKMEELVRRAGGTDEVIALRRRVSREDPDLPNELIRRFILDFESGLKVINRHGVLFLDAYESIWSGREQISAQCKLLDEWVTTLAEYCTGSGILLVISGREMLTWHEDGRSWSGEIKPHLVGGLSRLDSQVLLSRCGVHNPPPESETPLQKAIIECCNCQPAEAEIACHPLYLTLCAEIVLNERKEKGYDPGPELFRNIPNDQVAVEIANLFLRSLHNSAMELWVMELSLTPRFDEKAAMILDEKRNHNNGRSGWEQLKQFSFMEPLTNGFYRLHKTMRDAMQIRVNEKDAVEVHKGFAGYWWKRGERSIAWFHTWMLQPEDSLRTWQSQHESALKDIRIKEARILLGLWDDIPLDEVARHRLGDDLWAYTHASIAIALHETPTATLTIALNAAIEHYEASLQIFTKENFPKDWATTNNNLGNVFCNMFFGNIADNLIKAIKYYQTAMQVFTKENFPKDWAMTRNNLGNAYHHLPIGNKSNNLNNAIKCHKDALQVYTKESFPKDWAITQNNLGAIYSHLPSGNKNSNLERAIDYFESALRIFSRKSFPQYWASIQLNLGIVYNNLSKGDKTSNLKKAIDYSKADLQIYTKECFPFEWAQTQNSMGNTYCKLPPEDEADNFEKAIECYENALSIYTKNEFPQDWASTQNNLGIVYANKNSGNSIENFTNAINHYEATLQVHTDKDFPKEWSGTQYNIGMVYCKLFIHERNIYYLKKARSCFVLAASGFQKVGMTNDAAKALGRVAKLDAMMGNTFSA